MLHFLSYTLGSLLSFSHSLSHHDSRPIRHITLTLTSLSPLAPFHPHLPLTLTSLSSSCPPPFPLTLTSLSSSCPPRNPQTLYPLTTIPPTTTVTIHPPIPAVPSPTLPTPPLFALPLFTSPTLPVNVPIPTLRLCTSATLVKLPANVCVNTTGTCFVTPPTTVFWLTVVTGFAWVGGVVATGAAAADAGLTAAGTAAGLAGAAAPPTGATPTGAGAAATGAAGTATGGGGLPKFKVGLGGLYREGFFRWCG